MYITIKSLRLIIKEAFREDYVWNEDDARQLIINSMQEYAVTGSSEEINDFAADIISKLLSDNRREGNWSHIHSRSDKSERQVNTWRETSKNVMNLIDAMIADDTLTIFTKQYDDVEAGDSETRVKLSAVFLNRETADFNLDEGFALTKAYLRKLIREEIESKDLEPIFDKDWVIRQVSNEIGKFPDLPGAGVGAILSRSDKEIRAHRMNIAVDQVPLQRRDHNDKKEHRHNIIKIIDALVKDGTLKSAVEDGYEWVVFSDDYLQDQVKDFTLA